MVRHQQQYEFNFSAENMAIGSLKLPATEETEEQARLDERVTQLRGFLETMDLLYEAFVSRRASSTHWKGDLPRIQKWLAHQGEEQESGGSVAESA
jgi:hypothetical protein